MDTLTINYYMSALLMGAMAAVMVLIVIHVLFEIFDLLWSKFCSNDSDNSSNPEN